MQLSAAETISVTNAPIIALASDYTKEEIPVVDGKENYRRLCEFVENYTLEQEAKNR